MWSGRRRLIRQVNSERGSTHHGTAGTAASVLPPHAGAALRAYSGRVRTHCGTEGTVGTGVLEAWSAGAELIRVMFEQGLQRSLQSIHGDVGGWGSQFE